MTCLVEMGVEAGMEQGLVSLHIIVLVSRASWPLGATPKRPQAASALTLTNVHSHKQ